MIDKSVSDSPNATKDDVVNITCLNCLNVENDKDYNIEVPLAQIRKKQRRKFKLYSILVSEISQPKVMPTKQKIIENYNVGKKIEKEIISKTKNNVKDSNEVIKDEVDINVSKLEVVDHKISVVQFPNKNETQAVYSKMLNTVTPLNNRLKEEKVIDINLERKTKETNDNVDFINSAEKNDEILLDEVLPVNCSTPKSHKNESDLTFERSTLTTATETVIAHEEKEPQKNESIEKTDREEGIEDIITGIKNLTFLDKESNVVTRNQNTSLVNLASSNQKNTNKDVIEKQIAMKESSPRLNKSHIPVSITRKPKCTQDFNTSLPVLSVTQRNAIKHSSRYKQTEVTPSKALRWSTLDLKRNITFNDDEVYNTEAPPPNHPTLPRRSNSPLPHDRDLQLDSNRFNLSKSTGLPNFVRSESMASVYSGAGEAARSTVAVHGEVQISLLYNYRLGALEVGVKRCRELAPVDVKRNRSDPYVKVYLLPDKSKAGKRKTKVKKNTLNPVFEETLSFVQPLTSLSARTLWLSVWHADMFGRNDFLGEVTLPLADVVFDDPAPMWYKLHERTEQFDEQQGSRGDLIVALKLDLPENARGKGTLHVLVKEAKNLVATKPSGLANVFCKSYLLPERGRLAKQKTGVCSRTLNPKWEHTFTYRGITVQDLGSRALELSLWDRDIIASNDFMGAIRLSLGTGTYMGASVNWMDSVGKEVSLWQRMLQQPNFWVENSIPLRPHLNN